MNHKNLSNMDEQRRKNFIHESLELVLKLLNKKKGNYNYGMNEDTLYSIDKEFWVELLIDIDSIQSINLNYKYIEINYIESNNSIFQLQLSKDGWHFGSVTPESEAV